CYEGVDSYQAFDAADLSICENLYAAGPGAVTAPFFQYHHADKVVPGEGWPPGSSSISGMAFGNGDDYPSQYAGALYFADYSRDCIWVMPIGANGLPDPAQRATFVDGAANPVMLQIGPGGDLFYVDFNGSIRRISYGVNQSPTAVIS